MLQYKAPWPGKDHHTTGSLGCPQVSNVKPPSPWTQGTNSPGTQTKASFPPWTKHLLAEDTRFQTCRFSVKLACMQPPWKGRAFPSPLGAQSPAGWGSLLGHPSQEPSALQPCWVTRGQEQLAPLFHCCPGMQRPHCWPFRPLWESSRYFYGKYYLLF